MRRFANNQNAAVPRIIRNYKFAVYLRETPPPEFWEQARLMNALWNEMLDLREELIIKLKTLSADKVKITGRKTSGSEKKSQDAPKRAQSEEEKKLWLEFNQKLAAISIRPDWKEKLSNNAREYVFEKFRTASVAVFKDKGSLRRKSDSLKSIVIPARFTEGGWQVARVFEHTAKKLHIDPLPESVFNRKDWQSRRARMTTGFYGYGVDNRPLRLRILLHRPLPENGLIKSTGLVGKFDSLRRVWTWHLIVTCQTEAVEEAKPFKPAAAIDFGYRRMDDYLRIGYVLDTGGNQYELRLPIIEKPSRRLLNALRAVNSARARQHCIRRADNRSRYRELRARAATFVSIKSRRVFSRHDFRCAALAAKIGSTLRADKGANKGIIKVARRDGRAFFR